MGIEPLFGQINPQIQCILFGHRAHPFLANTGSPRRPKRLFGLIRLPAASHATGRSFLRTQGRSGSTPAFAEDASSPKLMKRFGQKLSTYSQPFTKEKEPKRKLRRRFHLMQNAGGNHTRGA